MEYVTQRQNLVYKKKFNVTKETKSEGIIGEYQSDQKTEKDFLILKETENDDWKIDLRSKLKLLKDKKHKLQTEKEWQKMVNICNL